MSAAALIVPPAAQYPALYTAARAALFRCDQVDECQEWANRAAALESYARQAKDPTLEDMAARIRARAIRRCGELLQKIPAVPPRLTRKASAVTRTTVATAAGLSEHHKNRALQVARVQADQFEELVEADKPASVSSLAKLGAKPRTFNRREGAVANRVKRFALWCDTTEAHELRGSIDSEHVQTIRAWCAKFLETT